MEINYCNHQCTSSCQHQTDCPCISDHECKNGIILQDEEPSEQPTEEQIKEYLESGEVGKHCGGDEPY